MQGRVSTQAFYLDARTGHLYHPDIASAVLAEGPMVDVLVLHGSSDPTLVLVTEDKVGYSSLTFHSDAHFSCLSENAHIHAA